MRPWALAGRLSQVDRLWETMQRYAVEPQARHLWAVLTACAYGGQPDTAAERYQERRKMLKMKMI